jgi:hypothetical protein
MKRLKMTKNSRNKAVMLFSCLGNLKLEKFNKNNLSSLIVLGVKIHIFIIILSIEFLAIFNFGKNCLALENSSSFIETLEFINFLLN